MLNIFHRHKFGPITKDKRYQYCEKCGKEEPVECNHHWINAGTVSVFGYDKKIPTSIINKQQCKHCGILTTTEIGNNAYV